MSFASSASSTLVPILPKFPTVDANSAGYIQIPALDYSATATGVAINAFAPITLPYGVYIVSGVLKYIGDGSNIATATAQCLIDGVNQGYITVNRRIKYNASDFYMARRFLDVPGYEDQTSKNNIDFCRALVSIATDDKLAQLFINYNNDFNAGVYIEGKTQIGGNLYINGGNCYVPSGNGYVLDGNANATFIRYDAGNSRVELVAPVGVVFSASAFNATSDYRLKDQVQTLSGSYYTVDNIRPVHYILKDSQIPHMGFIAHEVQEHFPTMVSGEKDGEIMQSVNYSELIPVLVKEIQESKAREKEKNQEIAELKSSIQSLQQEFTRMHQLVRTMEEKLGRFSPR